MREYIDVLHLCETLIADDDKQEPQGEAMWNYYEGRASAWRIIRDHCRKQVLDEMDEHEREFAEKMRREQKM